MLSTVPVCHLTNGTKCLAEGEEWTYYTGYVHQVVGQQSDVISGHFLMRENLLNSVRPEYEVQVECPTIVLTPEVEKKLRDCGVRLQDGDTNGDICAGDELLTLIDEAMK